MAVLCSPLAHMACNRVNLMSPWVWPMMPKRIFSMLRTHGINEFKRSYGTGVPGQYVQMLQWDVNAWYGQDLENKPYLAIGPDGRILVADPLYAVIYVYDPDGSYVATLQDVTLGLGMVSGLAVSDDGLLYVSDGKNNVIHVYLYPNLSSTAKVTSTAPAIETETIATPQD